MADHICVQCGSRYSGYGTGSCPNCLMRRTIQEENKKNREHAEKLERERQQEVWRAERERQRAASRLERDNQSELRHETREKQGYVQEVVRTTAKKTANIFNKLVELMDVDLDKKNKGFLVDLVHFLSAHSGDLLEIRYDGHHGFDLCWSDDSILAECFFRKNKGFKNAGAAVQWLESEFDRSFLPTLHSVVREEKGGKLSWPKCFSRDLVSFSHFEDENGVWGSTFSLRVPIKEPEDLMAAGPVFLIMYVFVERLLDKDLSDAVWTYDLKNSSNISSFQEESWLKKTLKSAFYLPLSFVNSVGIFLFLTKIELIREDSEPGWLRALTVISIWCATIFFTKSFKQAMKYHVVLFLSLGILGAIFS
jgi:hypothetical protein